MLRSTFSSSRVAEGLPRLLRAAGRLVLPALLLCVAPEAAKGQEAEAISSGDTSWILISTALVLLMTPGLAFFYGGLVRSKNALNTMMMSFIAFREVGDGKIFVIPVEEVHRIRTAERDSAAVTPVPA